MIAVAKQPSKTTVTLVGQKPVEVNADLAHLDALVSMTGIDPWNDMHALKDGVIVPLEIVADLENGNNLMTIVNRGPPKDKVKMRLMLCVP